MPKPKQFKDNKLQRRSKKWDVDEEISEILEKIESEDLSNVTEFSGFPLSSRTLKGLSKANYTKPTDIQKDGIALSLRGFDILGAARTGSGKTLAFIIPIIELLWREKWSNISGLGALIISPTRELAYQTFEVLRKVGCYHDFSAGLIIGGKDLQEEQQRIGQTNILICTPGRLLQHFDETPNFHCDNLKMLVLDEADRILDLGFAQTMNAIIENLPRERQTLLYSATQTKSVKDLARLSLHDPKYIAVHEQDKYSTPKKLSQCYCVIDLPLKINFLFSFIKNHLKAKTIVFASSCKQVKFMYEVFRKIRPGVPLLALYGKQKQLKRVGVYNKFCKSDHAVLFATDIAARGLDFPAVNWVVQIDCPEDANTYIHRVGRTARFQKGGQALLVLLPSEVALLKDLEEKKIPIHEIKPNPKKLRDIQGKLQAFCAQYQDIKLWAQKSVISYARSVYLQSKKGVFDVHKLPLDDYAKSLGLLLPPRIRFMKKLQKKIGPTEAKLAQAEKKQKLGIEVLSQRVGNSDSEDEDAADAHDEVEKVKNSEKSRQKQSKIEAPRATKDDPDDSEDDVLVLKEGVAHHDQLDAEDEKIDVKMNTERRVKAQSKATTAKKLLRKNIKMNTKITFGEDGEVTDTHNAMVDASSFKEIEESEAPNAGGIDISDVKNHMKEQDRFDRQRERRKVKERHREKRKKEREERKAAAVGSVPSLGVSEEDVEENKSLDRLLDMVSSESEEQEEMSDNEEPVVKRRKLSSKKQSTIPNKDSSSTVASQLIEDEELALNLLGT